VIGTLLLGFVPEIVRGLDQYRLIFTATATLLILILRPSGLITHTTVAAIKRGIGRMFPGAPLRGVSPR
jgi:branched-chain amino acid transport system permease protein